MPEDIMWQLFKDTGDPLCWLIHRAAVKEKDKAKADGDKPRST